MLQAFVSNISEICCKCFHTDIAKVDQNVTHIAMVVDVCCKLLFLMFYLFFPNVCCKCIYLDIAYVSHI
jgi:hypothetical protein